MGLHVLELTVTVRANIPMRLALILFAVIGPAGSVCRAGAAVDASVLPQWKDYFTHYSTTWVNA